MSLEAAAFLALSAVMFFVITRAGTLAAHGADRHHGDHDGR
jgi:hypothetical protein